MKTTKIFTIFAIISAIGLSTLLVNMSSPLALATSAGCGAGCGKIEETNPSTQNPHPQGKPQGNPHGQFKTVANPECPGSQ